MKKYIIGCVLTLMSVFLHAQNDQPEREAFKLKVTVDTLNYYSQDLPKSPYFVAEKVLQIYPSEKLFVEVEIKNDSIFSMKVVKENLHREKTIEIDFYQEVKGRVSERMMLKIKNPFDRKLNYKALMYINGAQDWIPTSIIPVHPKIMGIEMWQDIILSLVLFEWEILEK